MYTCEWCAKPHANEFSRTCSECDFEREGGDLHECKECEQLFEPPGNPDGCESCHPEGSRYCLAKEN